MKIKLLMLACLTIITIKVPAQSHWTQKGGGSGVDIGYAITTDNSGNIYTTGVFSGRATFGAMSVSSVVPGSNDVFIVKYNSSGVTQWLQHAGGKEVTEGHAINVDATGNVFVSGFFQDTAYFGTTMLVSEGQKDIFLAKLDVNGNFVWAVSAGGSSDDQSNGVSSDAAGNAYITGYFTTAASYGTINISSYGLTDIFLAKYSSAGIPSWVEHAGSSAPDAGNAVATDADGNSCLTGFFRDSASFGNKTIISYGATGSYDIFVATYDSSGTINWIRHAGGDGSDAGQGIAVGATGNVYVTGYYYTDGNIIFENDTVLGHGENDIFTAVYDSQGNLLKMKNAGGAKDEEAQAISVDFVGNIFITGQFRDTSNINSVNLYSHGLEDIFIVNYDPNFFLIGLKQCGGALSDYGYGITTDLGGVTSSTGYYHLNSAFGNTSLTSVGNNNADVFVSSVYDLTQNVFGFNTTRFHKTSCAMSSNDLVATTKDPFNNLITGMNGAGINVFDGNAWYVYDTATNAQVPTNNITTTFADANGNWWFGSSDMGLIKYVPSTLTWTTYNNPTYNIASNYVTAITAAPGGNLVIGHANNGIDVFDGTTFTNYLPGNKITTISYDSSYTYWIGTLDSGIVLFNGSSVTSVINTSTSSTLPSDSIRCFTFETGTAWVGTDHSGIAKYNGTTFTPYNTSNSTLPDNNINVIRIKKNAPGSVWIGTKKKGVVIFDGSLLHKFDTGNILFDNNITSLTDASNGVWAGTQYNGLVRIQESAAGIEDENDSKINFTCNPNPARDFSIVSFHVAKTSNTVLILTDVSGRKVFEKSFGLLTAGDYDYRINTEKLEQGTYLLQLFQNNVKTVNKLAVVK